jgi:lipid II:glycine glycyltransferase (peptidoglycan interpeptide bridge formation enzyme)
MAKKSDYLTLAFQEVIEESRHAFERSVKLSVNEILKVVDRQYKDLSRRIDKIEQKLGTAPKSGRKRPGRRPTQRVCSIEDCTRPHYAKGLCSSHYQKMRKEMNG